MAGQFISYSRQQKALEEIAELDTVVEEKKKELKKQKELDHFKERIKDIIITKEESQKEIDLWLGLYVPTKDGVKILKALILFMLICFVTFMVIENNIIKLIAIILFIISSAIGITAIFSFAEYEDKETLQKKRYEQLKEKTLSTDYTLDSDIIDCPIEVKKELWVLETIISITTQKMDILKRVTPKRVILAIYQMPLTMNMTTLKTN